MENVTHSLIGVVLGEGISRARISTQDPAEAKSWRTGILWASVLGSNLPDFDFLMRPFVGAGLGTLLHHRGYTHTVLLSVPLALIAAGVGRLASRWKSPFRTPWYLLLLAGWVGVLCHVGADFWNDYGVHPFWPFVDRWFYGDFIFIIEPLFWLCLLPFIFRASHTAWARGACLVLGGMILILAWSGKYMAWPVALWMCVWAAGWVLVHRRPRSVGVPFFALCAVLLMFAVPAQLVRARLRSALPAGETLLRISTTPAPANPLCWRVIVTSKTAGLVGNPPVDYFAREGVMVFQPFGVGAGGHFGANNPQRCPPRVFGENSALWAKVEAPPMAGLPGVTWAGEFRGSIKEFAIAEATHCRLQALLRFVRMPFWMIAPDGHLIAGDLRYHGGSGLGFADIESYVDEPCYAHEPGWEPSSGVL